MSMPLVGGGLIEAGGPNLYIYVGLGPPLQCRYQWRRCQQSREIWYLKSRANIRTWGQSTPVYLPSPLGGPHPVSGTQCGRHISIPPRRGPGLVQGP